MKIVLDTNVLVSGLLSPFSHSGEIVRLVASGKIEICYDARIFTEYKNVLTREKFPFDKNDVEDLLAEIKACGSVTTGKLLSERLTDPDDEPFLEIAVGGEVLYLVTGNLRHYPEKKWEGVRIVSPADFLKILRKK